MTRDEGMKIFAETMDQRGWQPGPVMEISVGDPRKDDADADDMIWMCQHCDVQLSRFQDSQGQESFVHVRSWIRYDHDPEPKRVPKDTKRSQLCDFCGLERPMMWAFKGQHMTNTTGNIAHDYGSVWSACADCSPLVAAGDPYPVIERTLRVSPTLREAQADLNGREANMMRSALMKLQGVFMASIQRKEYVGPPVEIPRLHPRILPKVRDGLARFWRHPDLANRLLAPDHSISIPGIHLGDEDTFAVTIDDASSLDHGVFAKHGHHIAVGIDVADMYWISEDFTTLATMAGQDLNEVVLNREDLPSTFGMLVYARPIGEIPRPYGVAGIRAVSWTLVPGGIWLNIYLQAEDGNPELTDVVEHRHEWGYLMSPNVGTGLPWGGLGTTDDKFRHTGNFVLTLLATFFLLQQPGVTATTEAPQDKKLVRSYQRAGKRLPAVKVVDLRRHTRARTDNETTKRGGPTVRFMVKGHWRNQAYGPKKGLRRMMYISPFIKGPDNAPLKEDVPTVRVLR